MLKDNKKFFSILIILFLTAVLISCPNDEMRDLVEIKVSDPVADTFIINDGTPTSTRIVTLNSDVTKEEDSLEMRFRNKNSKLVRLGILFKYKNHGHSLWEMVLKKYMQNTEIRDTML